MQGLLSRNKVIRGLASYHLTVICILLLIVLTTWGTLYQVEYGLYAAKARFFNSWFFMAGEFLPFPGGRLVMWISFLNLLTATFFRIHFKWSRSGMILTHAGMIGLLAGAAVTFHFSRESFVTLAEGEGTNVSRDYHDWELAIWKQTLSGDTLFKETETQAIVQLQVGDTVAFSTFGIRTVILKNLVHSRPFQNIQSKVAVIVNSSGITGFQSLPVSADPERNMPGLVFSAIPQGPGQAETVLLFGGDNFPTPVYHAGGTLYYSLRRKAHLLPLTLRLADFTKKEYPGTRMASSYESRVAISAPGAQREVVISMNKPLRYEQYTFYQSSYNQTEGGDYSTLAVVRNPGRLLPYISSLIISLGMALHFFQKLLKYAMGKKETDV